MLSAWIPFEMAFENTSALRYAVVRVNKLEGFVEAFDSALEIKRTQAISVCLCQDNFVRAPC